MERTRKTHLEKMEANSFAAPVAKVLGRFGLLLTRIGRSYHVIGYRRESMNRKPVPSRQPLVTPHAVGCGFACLALLVCFSRATIGQTLSEAQGSAPGPVIHATHLLGFEDVRPNANGQLRIQGDMVQFERNGSASAQLSISSIQDISLGTEDTQIGGVPMTLGKAAVPFEGGRAISLFSHKHYDTFTVEYRDNNGGFHGAIFRMNKGQGQAFENDLVTKGAHIGTPEIQARPQSTPEVKTPEGKHENK
jgi:hypothetical protein